MSDCIIGGYDMLDANSKAGRSDSGINLNSVTVRYTLNQNPETCRMIYEGIIPSYFGNGPTVEDCGTYIVPKEGDESVNPIELVSNQIPTHNFTGALAPQLHNNAQPQFRAASVISSSPGSTYGNLPPTMMQPQQSQMISPYFQQVVPSNEDGIAMREWEEYQRRKGFKAPIPTDTDFPGYGLLSGFHKGFDPHQALLPKDDEFYDASINGRVGISEWVHQQLLAQNALVWGYQPGQVVERRENMMFPGINEDHHIPVPANGPVFNHMGYPQTRAVPRQLGNTAMPVNQLPIPGMVQTNPYMAGMQYVGGVPMNQMMGANIPTPYMQARYNYAIANGFQSVQEMDMNDFLVLKQVSRICNSKMTDDEFAEHFERNWCKRFTDIYDADKEIKAKEKERLAKENAEAFKVCAYIMKGDKIIAGADTRNDPYAQKKLASDVKNLMTHKISPQQQAIFDMQEEQKRQAKLAACAYLYHNAPERKYDHDAVGYMCHGFVESIFWDLNVKDWVWWNSPNRYLVQNRINQTEYMRNCLERGLGFGTPAAHSRLAMENMMFYVNEDLPEDDDLARYKGFIRGSYGKGPTGDPLPDGVMPLYGYITIADPKDPTRSIPFPRRFLRDLYEGYTRFAAASAAKSKKPFHIMDYQEFETATGVRVLDDKEFLKEYGDFEPASKYISIAKRGVAEEEDLNAPIHANSPNEDVEDFEGPTDDIPLDVLLKDLEEEEALERSRKS